MATMCSISVSVLCGVVPGPAQEGRKRSYTH
jgi:hypothetical protein